MSESNNTVVPPTVEDLRRDIVRAADCSRPLYLRVVVTMQDVGETVRAVAVQRCSDYDYGTCADEPEEIAVAEGPTIFEAMSRLLNAVKKWRGKQ